MGQVTSLFVHKVIAQADDSLDKHAFLEAVGVDPEAPVDPKVMVKDTDYYRFFADLARADPKGLELPLRTGASMRCEEYGAFGLAWKSAPTLRGSCERASRYARVLTSVATYQVSEAEEGVYMHLNRDGDRSQLGLRLSNEATIASIAAISQEISTTTFQAKAIYFKHGAPGSTSAHERHFGCPVHFNTKMDALLISHETMQASNQVGDPAIVKFFESHLDEELSKLDNDATLERLVRTQIAQSLSEGIPAVSDIASRFNMSARTLQRRLSERGYSFQNLIDEARRELAKQLLRETRFPLAQIAFLTGFSEQSAFNRAFKRWAGQTPRSFRLKA
ncbi:MAG: AraC family transcriptional regulator ligand-binding domain-containing protein [Xanthomonadales bacterium]|nr:AraC family transcriptional regulator ligand-binding domain-containing protein [Xanthomonadales bacterium]